MTASIQQFLRGAGKLPSLPSIYQELARVTRDVEASVEDLCRVISRDQSLVARLLRLANSAFYGMPSRVLTIDEAVQLIGSRGIHELVLATSVLKCFGPDSACGARGPVFWEHSIACGLASALIAEECHVPMPERLFVGGLLHDIGRLLLFLKAPELSAQISTRCEENAELALLVEREILGFHHGELGAELISSWGLPQVLAETVSSHHYPKRAQLAPEDTAIVHYADFVVNALDIGNSGAPCIPPLQLPDDCQFCLIEADRLESFVEKLDQQCKEIFPILLKSGDE